MTRTIEEVEQEINADSLHLLDVAIIEWELSNKSLQVYLKRFINCIPNSQVVKDLELHKGNVFRSCKKIEEHIDADPRIKELLIKNRINTETLNQIKGVQR